MLVSLVDPHFQLEVINRWWGPAFSPVLPESMRPVVTDLRTARNHWAHPDADHPFDLDYALRSTGGPRSCCGRSAPREADQHRPSWPRPCGGSRSTRPARESGQPEAEVLFEELVRLESEQESLSAQLAEAREAATTATGRSRAISRQLAELQAQYAAVAGLRDDYLALQRQLDAERSVREADERDTGELRQRLDAHGRVVRAPGGRGRGAARRARAHPRARWRELDPVDTEIGRRWIWLVTALIVVLGVLIALIGYTPR